MLLMQVVLAVDASRSMAENGCGVFALEATTLLARALSRLEVHCFVLLMFSLSLHEACRHCSFSGLVVLPRDALYALLGGSPGRLQLRPARFAAEHRLTGNVNVMIGVCVAVLLCLPIVLMPSMSFAHSMTAV